MTGPERSEPRWVRSRKCADGNCLEVRHSAGEVSVRNSRTSDRVLRFTPAEWDDFLAGVKRGDFG
jgi:hypothetical protein